MEVEQYFSSMHVLVAWYKSDSKEILIFFFYLYKIDVVICEDLYINSKSGSVVGLNCLFTIFMS